MCPWVACPSSILFNCVPSNPCASLRIFPWCRGIWWTSRTHGIALLLRDHSHGSGSWKLPWLSTGSVKRSNLFSGPKAENLPQTGSKRSFGYKKNSKWSLQGHWFLFSLISETSWPLWTSMIFLWQGKICRLFVATFRHYHQGGIWDCGGLLLE